MGVGHPPARAQRRRHRRSRLGCAGVGPWRFGPGGPRPRALWGRSGALLRRTPFRTVRARFRAQASWARGLTDALGRRRCVDGGSGRGRAGIMRRGGCGALAAAAATLNWVRSVVPAPYFTCHVSPQLRSSGGDGTKSPYWRAETMPQPNRRPRSRTSTVARQHDDSTMGRFRRRGPASSARQRSVASKSKPAGLSLLERRRPAATTTCTRRSATRRRCGSACTPCSCC